MYNFYIKNATSISINNHLNYEFLNSNHGHLLSITIEYVSMVIRLNPQCFDGKNPSWMDLNTSSGFSQI
jgi:hypothetical protein